MNKKLMIFGVIGLFTMALVAAGVYYVNTINLTVDVQEAFTVEYAILGDAGNYNGELCSWANVTYYPLANDGVFDKDGFYPMESRKVCVKITNAGEASIPYVITSTTTGTNNVICKAAFADTQLTGNADSGVTIDGALVTIAADAIPINDCNVKIEVGRGTLA